MNTSNDLNNGGDFSGFNLREKLALFNLEEHMDEIVQNIWGNKFSDAFLSGNTKSWDVEKVARWVGGLQFLGEKRASIAVKLREECIDGELLPKLSEYQWIEKLGIDFLSYYMMELIFHGWALGNRQFQIPTNLGTVPLGQLLC